MDDTLFMGIEELKLQTSQIKYDYKGKRSIRWPLDFKKQVVELISSGFSAKEVSSILQISYPLISGWYRRHSKPAKSEDKNREASFFKEVSLLEESESISVLLKSGVQVKGLCLKGLKDLLNEGLI